MPKNVQMPDGKIVEFPDSMSNAEVSNAIRTSNRPQITQPKATLNKGRMAPGEFGQGFIHTIPNMLLHPLRNCGILPGQPFTAAGMAPGGMYPTTASTGRSEDEKANRGIQLQAQEGQRQAAEGIKENPAYAAGGLASQVVAGGALKGLGRVAPVAGEAIRSAAIGDPDVAALRGLRVPPSSPKTLRTVSAVQGARPFLQGAQSLEDVQAKIPGAKEEIWGPYKQTVDAISGKKVNGPDGPTTVGQLESDRVQLSALNRALKQRNPEAIQLAQQKGMTQAQLLDQEKAIKTSLDPHLEEAGIKPQAILQAFGQVAQVGERVSGKSTLGGAKAAIRICEGWRYKPNETTEQLRDHRKWLARHCGGTIFKRQAYGCSIARGFQDWRREAQLWRVQTADYKARICEGSHNCQHAKRFAMPHMALRGHWRRRSIPHFEKSILISLGFQRFKVSAIASGSRRGAAYVTVWTALHRTEQILPLSAGGPSRAGRFDVLNASPHTPLYR